MNYKLGELQWGCTEPTYVIRSDGRVIPLKEGNANYQKYLEWLAEGNTPTPADS